MNIENVTYRDWSLDLEKETFYRSGRQLRLQPGIMQLLVYLVKNEGRRINKAELASEVWSDTSISNGAIYSRVNSLRNAIGDTNAARRCLTWVYGEGLLFLRPTETQTTTNTPAGSFEEQQVSQLAPLSPPAGIYSPSSFPENDELLGAYFEFFRTPSWPNSVVAALTVLSRQHNRIVVRTAAYRQSNAPGLRQKSRFRGFAEIFDSRLYIVQQNTRHPHGLDLHALDLPHRNRPNLLTGLAMMNSWRLTGAPFVTRVVWQRVPKGMSVRNAVKLVGPQPKESELLCETIEEALGNDCLFLPANR